MVVRPSDGRICNYGMEDSSEVTRKQSDLRRDRVLVR